MQSFKPVGTCSKEIRFEVEDGILRHVEFIGGCRGNARAVAKLAVGRPVPELIALLEGIPCRGKYSCPDQLAQALKPEGARAAPAGDAGAGAPQFPGTFGRVAIVPDASSQPLMLAALLGDAAQQAVDAVFTVNVGDGTGEAAVATYAVVEVQNGYVQVICREVAGEPE